MNIRLLCRVLLNHASAFIPVIVFLLYGRFGVDNTATRWEIAYLIGGALSLPHMIWLLYQQQHRWISLGIDVYIAIGALLTSFSEHALEIWGQQLGTVAAVGSVFVTGIVATICPRKGLLARSILTGTR